VALSDPFKLCASWVCARDGGGRSSPHEGFAIACVVVFVLWQTLSEGFMVRHFACSPSAMRSWRVWTLLSSSISHCDPLHLLHNLASLFAVAPQLAARVPCREVAQFILSSALASALASLLWASLDHRRPPPFSLGASGVVLAVFAASAALVPDQHIILYGIEMSAKHAQSDPQTALPSSFRDTLYS